MSNFSVGEIIDGGAIPAGAEIACASCGLAKAVRKLAGGAPALPPGWKRLGAAAHCAKCWAARYVLRTQTLPVASALPDGAAESPDALRDGWSAYRAALRQSGLDAARLLNWFVAELALADNAPLVRGEHADTLPKFAEPKGLYERARLLWPGLDSQSVGSLLQKARAKYRETRFDRRVLCSVSLPSWRAPCPVPVPAKDARLSFDAGGRPWVRVRLAGQAFRLRLRTGEHRRQLLCLRRVLAGEAAQGDVALRERRVGGAHLNGGSSRAQHGAGRAPARYLCGVCVWLPAEARGREGTLRVRTGKDFLLSAATPGGGEPWFWHDDNARSRHVGHLERLRRLSDDTKFERRRPRKRRAAINGRLDEICAAHRDWLDTYLHRLARTVLGIALRCRCAGIVYDDGERGWLERWPFFKLRQRLAAKCAEVGLTFSHSPSSVGDREAEALEEGEDVD